LRQRTCRRMSVRQGSGEGLRRQRLLGGRSSGFVQRSEAHLARHGRANAASLSRVAEPMLDVGEVEDGDEVDDDGGRSTMSKVSRAPSVAPSLHPSMAGSVRSMACSEVTVGAGDRTECASAAPQLRHGSCCMLHPTPQSRCRCGRGEPSPGADVGRQRDSTRRPSTSCMLRGVACSVQIGTSSIGSCSGQTSATAAVSAPSPSPRSARR
jgi:hypothetical protein